MRFLFYTIQIIGDILDMFYYAILKAFPSSVVLESNDIIYVNINLKSQSYTYLML